VVVSRLDAEQSSSNSMWTDWLASCHGWLALAGGLDSLKSSPLVESGAGMLVVSG
jgi:hypothetical protein